LNGLGSQIVVHAGIATGLTFEICVGLHILISQNLTIFDFSWTWLIHLKKFVYNIVFFNNIHKRNYTKYGIFKLLLFTVSVIKPCALTGISAVPLVAVNEVVNSDKIALAYIVGEVTETAPESEETPTL